MNVFERYGCKHICVAYDKYQCNGCKWNDTEVCNRDFYPDITDSKIIRLEEMIADKYSWTPQYFKLKSVRTGKPEWSCVSPNDRTPIGCGKDRTEALNDLLVKLYDSFSEDERKQIKSILEA